MTAQADLVYLDDERPVLVVEAKGRRITEEFRNAVDAQVKWLLESSGAHWLLLVDTEEAQLYQDSNPGVAAACVPTADLLQAAGMEPKTPRGESTVLYAAEKWLDALRSSGATDRTRQPALLRMTSDLSQTNRAALDYRVA